jgi:predicted helicase
MEKNSIEIYVEAIRQTLVSGQAREHGYRPALERLMFSFNDVLPVNDPKRSEHGNPDFIFLKHSNQNIILGYAEAKDISVDLDKIENNEQMHRYAGYDNLFLTNYLDFRFFRNGNKYQTITIGVVKDNNLSLYPDVFNQLKDELESFLEQPPEKIKSGIRLAQIMGAKARRIRDNVIQYLSKNDERNQYLEKIFTMVHDLLVHDITPEKFADMYAQTLVYGLFVARYNDENIGNFTRSKARDLVPASNPFLQEFFDHIVGPHFDNRLGYIVDELCEVFSVSDVRTIVHKHLKVVNWKDDEKDPIIHFYEDFLDEYDPLIRKQMGAYYTPLPVVRFIVHNVDDILKRDFELHKGLSDSSMKSLGTYKHGNKRLLPRVEILDPAMGTGTFLNEIIKYIQKDFIGSQAGQWPLYAKEDLIPRLYGFELMMAPYTIAHLKIGLTLDELGVKDFGSRLNLYLTNTLEEGSPRQIDLLSDFGLSEVVAHEAQEAAIIKQEQPIMVIVGNPPYSISSTNKSKFILYLIKDYKKDLHERKINLDDDYIKFIRFAEHMIEKNLEGIVAIITNNSFIDGITHRQMRKHLLETFDKIYILNLHGNSKKKEVNPDGGKDENIFDIQQGVSISIFVKQSKSKSTLAHVYHAEKYGLRKEKFSYLNNLKINWKEVIYKSPGYYFVPKDFSLQYIYDDFIPVKKLFIKSSAGVKTKVDHIAVDFNHSDLSKRMIDIIINKLDLSQIKEKYGLNDNTTWEYKPGTINDFNYNRIVQYEYRPFDIRYLYYDEKFLSRSRSEVMNNFYNHKNIGLELSRVGDYVFIGNHISDEHFISDNSYKFPLFIYHEDGTFGTNFQPSTLKIFSKNLKETYKPIDILDYIYAILNNPNYRKKYTEFLKIDYPNIPIPNNDQQFCALNKLGKQLRELHLMTYPGLDNLVTSFPESGTNNIDKVLIETDKVWINATQYFGNISGIAWSYFIGGYQPAQKWLKDRKGSKLTSKDIEHYQQIIKILLETDKIVKQISDIS